MNVSHQKVIKYYASLETRLGFNLILRGSKHFGFYPTGTADITEKEAQIILQDQVAKNLGLKSNQMVLDAGCGQGVVSTYLAQKTRAKIFGITLVAFEVKSAQKLAKRLGVQDKTNYQIMDYAATNFPDNYFDAIYTTETLSHSPDINRTLTEFLRILKPGGKIALFEYTLAPDKKFTEREMKMLDIVAEGSAMMGLKNFRHNLFTDTVKSAGFENVKQQNITRNILPSIHRLYKLSKLPYKFIEFFGLQKRFVNTTAGYEYYKLVDKGLIRYCIFTGNSPPSPE